MTTSSSTTSRVASVGRDNSASMTVTSTVTASSVDTSIIASTLTPPESPTDMYSSSLSATPETSTNEPQITANESADSPVGIIVGCVVGIIFCFALMLLVIILICYYIKSNRAKFVIAQGM